MLRLAHLVHLSGVTIEFSGVLSRFTAYDILLGILFRYLNLLVNESERLVIILKLIGISSSSFNLFHLMLYSCQSNFALLLII